MHCEADERSTTEYDSGSGKGRGARRALTNGEGTLLQPEMIPIIQPLAPDSTGSDIIGINQCVLYARKHHTVPLFYILSKRSPSARKYSS